jgi:hypothetical protein
MYYVVVFIKQTKFSIEISLQQLLLIVLTANYAALMSCFIQKIVGEAAIITLTWISH